MAVSSLVPAVSGPTLAEITTAITTNAAPASVTNSSIATQVANNATPFGGTWTTISDAAFPNATSVTISGLGSYKYIRIIFNIAISGSAGSDGIYLRFNGSAGSDYNYVWTRQAPNQTSPETVSSWNDSLIQFTQAGQFAGTCTGSLTISGAQSGGRKIVDYGPGQFRSGQTGTTWGGWGIWSSSAALTSFTIFNNAAAFPGGKLIVLGAN